MSHPRVSATFLALAPFLFFGVCGAKAWILTIPESPDPDWFKYLTTIQNYDPAKKYEFFNFRKCKYSPYPGEPVHDSYMCWVDYKITTVLGTKTCIERRLFTRNPANPDADMFSDQPISDNLTFLNWEYDEEKNCGPWEKEEDSRTDAESATGTSNENKDKSPLLNTKGKTAPMEFFIGVCAGAFLTTLVQRIKRK